MKDKKITYEQAIKKIRGYKNEIGPDFSNYDFKKYVISILNITVQS